MEEGRRFSRILHDVSTYLEGRPQVTLEEILQVAGPKGHPFLALFLVLPFLQPIPLPGLSVILGTCIIVVGLFMVLSRPPWLPRRFARRKMSADSVLRITHGLERLVERLEFIGLKPRGRRYFAFPTFHIWSGIAFAVLGFLLSLPLPIPASNAIPAWAIAILSLGLLEEDAIALLLGSILVFCNFVFFLALAASSIWGFEILSRHWTG